MSYTRRHPLIALARRTLAMVAVGAFLTIASAWALAGFARFPDRPPVTFFIADRPEHRYERVPVRDGVASVTIDSSIGVRRYSQNFEKGTCSLKPNTRIAPSIVATIEDRFRNHEGNDAFEFQWGILYSSPLEDEYIDETAGWPAAALTHDIFIGVTSDPVIHWGIPRPVKHPSSTLRLLGYLPHDRLAALPLRPMWPGFAINTALFASLCWLTLFGIGALRRSHRRRRGLCERCAYDRRGLAGAHTPCPECGHALVTIRA